MGGSARRVAAAQGRLHAGYAPFRATFAGLADLGAYPPGASGASADAVSVDGEIIAGTLAGIGGIFRWTAATGMTEIVSAATTTPVALSDDGSVVAGSHDEPGALQSMAVRWSEASGVTALTPGIESRMSFMSASGSVIAGTLGEQGTEGVFVWNESEGARPLEDALASQGADLQGWEFGPPLALSADGSVLVGEDRCGGVLTPYRAVLAN